MLVMRIDKLLLNFFLWASYPIITISFGKLAYSFELNLSKQAEIFP